MQPFEFLIKSRPVSQQTRNRKTRSRSKRLREWREFVKQEATRVFDSRPCGWSSLHHTGLSVRRGSLGC